MGTRLEQLQRERRAILKDASRAYRWTPALRKRWSAVTAELAHLYWTEARCRRAPRAKAAK